jgi:hypothetical protein
MLGRAPELHIDAVPVPFSWTSWGKDLRALVVLKATGLVPPLAARQKRPRRRRQVCDCAKLMPRDEQGAQNIDANYKSIGRRFTEDRGFGGRGQNRSVRPCGRRACGGLLGFVRPVRFVDQPAPFASNAIGQAPSPGAQCDRFKENLALSTIEIVAVNNRNASVDNGGERGAGGDYLGREQSGRIALFRRFHRRPQAIELRLGALSPFPASGAVIRGQETTVVVPIDLAHRSILCRSSLSESEFQYRRSSVVYPLHPAFFRGKLRHPLRRAAIKFRDLPARGVGGAGLDQAGRGFDERNRLAGAKKGARGRDKRHRQMPCCPGSEQSRNRRRAQA